MIKAEIICDSVNPAKCRLTTFLVKYPRYIHSEFLRHRVFSVCAQSSRAVSSHKMIKAVWDNPVYPLHWGVNQAGMQAQQEMLPSKQLVAKNIWRLSWLASLGSAWILHKIGLHKQVLNRILEPYSHITHIVQATDWGNFFNLRCSPEAQPEFKQLARQMLVEYARSFPKQLKEGDWHLPFGDRHIGQLSVEDKIKVSVARCARTSYVNFDGDFSFEKDAALYEKLLSSGHFSPFEFPCAALASSERVANLTGWKSFRKTIQGENQSEFNVNELLNK